jgi:phage gpG-like protein
MADLVITAESDLSKVLVDLQAQGARLHSAMPAVASLLFGAVQDVFAAEGPGWAQLAESTIERRRNKDKGSIKILRDTGVLVGSISTRYASTYAEALAGAAYGIFHVTGTSRMPRRDFTALGPFEAPLLEDVAAMLMEHFLA